MPGSERGGKMGRIQERGGRQLPIAEGPRPLGTRCCVPPGAGLAEQAAARLAADAGVLAHPVWLQLLSLIAGSGVPVCVCDLEASVPVKQPTVSHHLRLLREAGLVRAAKRGLWVYYESDRSELSGLRTRLAAFLNELTAPAARESEAV
jgi:ArsR family transcriptional regulator, arsenate/arsenite/antimonite-responsive transcriptional repressor